MKTYFLNLTIQDGEAEYSDHAIVEARNIDEAIKIGNKIAGVWFGDEHDYRIAKVASIAEIPKNELKTTLYILSTYNIAYDMTYLAKQKT